MIAGSGGQGILFMGKLICQAAMNAGKNVTWFPSYGAEMRGGTANCTVVISDDLIGSPIVKNPDMMIILNKASYDKFQPRVIAEGTLLYDCSLITNGENRADLHISAVPSTQIASDMGNPRLSNMVLLGAFIASSDILNKEYVSEALQTIVPAHRAALIKTNLSAIEKGIDFVEAQKSNAC